MAHRKETQEEFKARILQTIPAEQRKQWLKDHIIIPAYWDTDEWEAFNLKEDNSLPEEMMEAHDFVRL